MSKKKPGAPGEDPEEGLHHSIDEIENLHLPKRGGRRRSVYLGEKLNCWVSYGDTEEHVEIVDLSTGGLAMVETRGEQSFPCAVAQKVTLSFNRGQSSEFAIEGEVSNVSEVKMAGQEYKRIGIRFSLAACRDEKAFVRQIPDRLFACHGLIRPQAACKDPFFFDELVLFQINGFSCNGIDLLLSARCKTMLPNQPVELDIYIPGRGRFLATITNSELRYKTSGNQFRIYGRFRKPDKNFLEAVSEHMIMFSRDARPNLLRDQGFTVGDLSHAFEISYGPLDDNVLKNEKLKPAIISPATVAGKDTLDAYARKISCKLGPCLSAVLSLVFVEGNRECSKFIRDGHQISDEILASKHLELSDLYLSQDILLIDILLPLLKNLARITIQSGSRFLLLEASVQIRQILLKTGFVEHGDPLKRKLSDGQEMQLSLLVLDVKKALLNKNRFLPEAIWKKVYEDLFNFFKNQMKSRKSAGII